MERKSTVDRFMEKIVMEPNTGCWLWIAGTNGRRYGTFWMDEKTIPAHRASWSIYRGSIPNGAEVLHSCDTPECCNPHHLFLGTQADNIHDCIKKGRFVLPETKGEKNSQAKLTNDVIFEIKADTRPQRIIARHHGVSQKLVWLIKHGIAWPHIQTGIPCHAAQG